MISGALSFISDKRPQFTRSETMTTIDLNRSNSTKRPSGSGRKRSSNDFGRNDYNRITDDPTLTGSSNYLEFGSKPRCQQRGSAGSDGDLSISEYQRQLLTKASEKDNGFNRDQTLTPIQCSKIEERLQLFRYTETSKFDETEIKSSMTGPFLPSSILSFTKPKSATSQDNESLASTDTTGLQEVKQDKLVSIESSDDLMNQSSRSYLAKGSRLARMTAKAVSKAGRSAKIKRSSSSAHLGRSKRPVSPEIREGRGRSTSIDIDPTSSNSSENILLTNMMVDSHHHHRSPISHSDKMSHSTSQHKSPKYSFSSLVDFDAMHEQLYKMAWSDSPQFIDCKAANSGDNEEDINLGAPIRADQWLDNRSITSKRVKVRFDENVQKQSSASGVESTKLDRQKMKLRRNNSSINCASKPLGRPNSGSNIATETRQLSAMSQLAGDLILASSSKSVMETNNNNCTLDAIDPIKVKQLRLIRDELFVLIEANNMTSLLMQWAKFIGWSRDVANQPVQIFTDDQSGLSPLDLAYLIGSSKVITLLLGYNIQPGAILQKALNSQPSDITICNVLKNHLNEGLKQLDTALQASQSIHTELTNQIQVQLNWSDGYLSSNEQSLDELHKQITEVVEPEMRRQLLARSQLDKYCQSLAQYPLFPLPPRKVTVVVSGSQSVLVRINQPANKRIHWNPFSDDPEAINGNDLMIDTNSSTDSECFDQENVPKQGGRLNQEAFQNVPLPNHDLSASILRYRIEWSTDRDFKRENVSSCIVVPPVDKRDLFDSNELRVSSKCEEMNSETMSCVTFTKGYYNLSTLNPGTPYYFRVFSFSIRGWSTPCYSQPRSATPSAWCDCPDLDRIMATVTKESSIPEKVTQRFYGQDFQTDLTHAIRSFEREISECLDRGFTETFNPGTTTSSTLTNDDMSSSTSSNTSVVKPRTKSPKLQRKRSFRFLFNSKAIKFVKSTKSGIYLAVLIHTPIGCGNGDLAEKSQIALLEDSLPLLNVTKEEYNGSLANLQSDINWLNRIICLMASSEASTSDCSSIVPRIVDQLIATNQPGSCQLRFNILVAVNRLRSALGRASLGSVYTELIRAVNVESSQYSTYSPANSTSLASYSSTNTINAQTPSDELIDFVDIDSSTTPVQQSPVTSPNTSIIVTLVKCVSSTSDLSLTSGLKWSPMDKFIRQNKFTPDLYPILFVSTKSHDDCRPLKIDHELEIARQYQLTCLPSTSLTPETNLLTHIDHALLYSQNRTSQLPAGLYLTLIQMHARMGQQPSVLIGNVGSITNQLPVELVRKRWHVSLTEWQTIVKASTFSVSSQSQPRLNGKFKAQLYRAWIRMAGRLNINDDDAMSYRFFTPEIIRPSSKHSFIVVMPSCDEICLPPSISVDPAPTCAWFPLGQVEQSLAMTYNSSVYSNLAGLSALLDLILSVAGYLRRQCINNSDLEQGKKRMDTLQAIQTQIDQWLTRYKWLSEVINLARSKKRSELVTIGCDELFREAKCKVVREKGSIRFAQQTEEKRSGTGRRPSDGLVVDTSGWARLRIYSDYPCGLAKGTSVRLLVNTKATADEIVQLVVESLSRTSTTKLGVSYRCRRLRMAGFDVTDIETPTPTSNRSCWLVVTVGDKAYNVALRAKPLLFSEPWRSGRLSVRQDKQLPTVFDVIPQIDDNDGKRSPNRITKSSCLLNSPPLPMLATIEDHQANTDRKSSNQPKGEMSLKLVKNSQLQLPIVSNPPQIYCHKPPANFK